MRLQSIVWRLLGASNEYLRFGLDLGQGSDMMPCVFTGKSLWNEASRQIIPSVGFCRPRFPAYTAVETF